MNRKDIRSSHYDKISALYRTLQHQGDFDAHAASIRTIASAVAFLLEDTNELERKVEDPKA